MVDHGAALVAGGAEDGEDLGHGEGAEGVEGEAGEGVGENGGRFVGGVSEGGRMDWWW